MHTRVHADMPACLRTMAPRLRGRVLEIGAGLGEGAGKVWRIGLMGYASRPENVLLCVSALEAVLSSSNAPINRGVALDAVQAALGSA